jgi:hypothetical protein
MAHNDDFAGKRAHHLEIVTDEEISEAAPLLKSRRRSTICACTDMSSAEVGSSRTMNFGSRTIVRGQTPMRCCDRQTIALGSASEGQDRCPTWRSSPSVVLRCSVQCGFATDLRGVFAGAFAPVFARLR